MHGIAHKPWMSYTSIVKQNDLAAPLLRGVAVDSGER
jgi:hypothetical protein